MAMAALDTIVRNFRDLGVDETHYDRIITGDLWTVGRRLLLDYPHAGGIPDREPVYGLGGLEDVFTGGAGYPRRRKRAAGVRLRYCADIFCRRSGSGSGSGCCFCLRTLLSTVSFNEGKSVPGSRMRWCWRQDDRISCKRIQY